MTGPEEDAQGPVGGPGTPGCGEICGWSGGRACRSSVTRRPEGGDTGGQHSPCALPLLAALGCHQPYSTGEGVGGGGGGVRSFLAGEEWPRPGRSLGRWAGCCHTRPAPGSASPSPARTQIHSSHSCSGTEPGLPGAATSEQAPPSPIRETTWAPRPPARAGAPCLAST